MGTPVKHLIVKMRPRRLSGISGSTYVLAPFDHIAGLHIYLIHMGIPGPVAETVVDHHIVAISETRHLHLYHCPVGSGIDRIADMACEIDPFMICGTPGHRIRPPSERT